VAWYILGKFGVARQFDLSCVGPHRSRPAAAQFDAIRAALQLLKIRFQKQAPGSMEERLALIGANLRTMPGFAFGANLPSL
jgi:hypothetical protein